MATAQELDPSYLGVRDTLKNQFKVTDERIGYDPKSGYVTIDGQNIFKPPTNVQGTTYAPQSVFNSAAGTINALNRQYDLQNQVLNPQQNTNPYDQRFNDLLDQLTQRVQTPAQINPYESAQYEAAQAQMQRQAQQSTRQAQESLGGAGLGRSSVLSDRAQRIQNDANEYLETQIVPQIVSQIQAQQQQELNNLMNILGAIGQQQSLYDNRTQNQFGNQFDVLNFLTGRQDRAQNIQREDEAIAREMQQLSEEKAYRSQRDTEEDRRWWADYNRRGEEFAQQMGYNWAQLSQREKERLADEAYRQQSLQLDRDRLSLQKQELEKANEIDMEAEKRGLIDQIRGGVMSPIQALRQIDEDLSLGFYTQQQADQLKRILSTIAPSAPVDAPSDQQKRMQEDYVANLPSDKELEKQARELGYPVLDYRSYMKNPNGAMAGLTFEQWMNLYGPKITAR